MLHVGGTQLIDSLEQNDMVGRLTICHNVDRYGSAGRGDRRIGMVNMTCKCMRNNTCTYIFDNKYIHP